MRSPCPWFLLRRVSPEQTRQATPTHRCNAEDSEIVVPKILAGATLGGRSGWPALSGTLATAASTSGRSGLPPDPERLLKPPRAIGLLCLVSPANASVSMSEKVQRR